MYTYPNHDQIKPNEYQCTYDNGTKGTTIAAKYKFNPKKKQVTFGYWRKDIFTNRYKMIEFTIDGVVNVSQIITVKA